LYDYKSMRIFFIILVIATISLVACKDTNTKSETGNAVTDIFTKDVYDTKAIVSQVEAALKGPLMFCNDSISGKNLYTIMYDNTAKNCLWVAGNGISNKSAAYLKLLPTIAEHGLEPNLFYYDTLNALATVVKSKNASPAILQLFEKGMSISFNKLIAAMQQGIYTPETFNKEWYNKRDSININAKQMEQYLNADSMPYLLMQLQPQQKNYTLLKDALKTLKLIEKNNAWATDAQQHDTSNAKSAKINYINLRKRLQTEIGQPTDVTSNAMTDDLIKAIMQFQYKHDLKITGIVDTVTKRWLNTSVQQKIKIVKTNLERMRWMQHTYKQPYVYVNIPSMNLNYVDNDSNKFNMRVVVGRNSRPTPTLDAPMSNVVINPGWNVPPTIMKEEVVPGIARRGGAYLSKRGLKAFLHGRAVDASMINESNYKRFSIQQKPGLNSALGAVKFNMPNRHAIYLHDTPHRNDFVKYYRAYSSGCIRVHHPREFAEFVLQDSNYTKPKIDSLIKNRITREVPLKKNIDVHLVYLTSSLDSAGNLIYLRDIYNQDAKLNVMWK
jgi:L,D-transpeptidase YcbB